MVIPAQIDGEVLPVHGIAGGSALAVLESPFSGLTPAQRELRRLVLDSVPAASSKLAYGHALDHLFGFSAGRALSKGLRSTRRGRRDMDEDI